MPTSKMLQELVLTRRTTKFATRKQVASCPKATGLPPYPPTASSSDNTWEKCFLANPVQLRCSCMVQGCPGLGQMKPCRYYRIRKAAPSDAFTTTRKKAHMQSAPPFFCNTATLHCTGLKGHPVRKPPLRTDARQTLTANAWGSLRPMLPHALVPKAHPRKRPPQRQQGRGLGSTAR